MCGECDELFAPIGEKRISPNRERNNTLFAESSEGSIDLALIAGVEQMDLLSYGTSRRLHVSRLGGEIRTLWVQEPGDSVGCRHQLMQQTQSLCLQLH